VKRRIEPPAWLLRLPQQHIIGLLCLLYFWQLVITSDVVASVPGCPRSLPIPHLQAALIQ
jgi:hypothetical protein